MPIKAKTSKKPTVKKTPIKKPKADYIFSVGRRKSSTARIRYYNKGDGEIIINTKDYKLYFPYFELQKIVEKPLHLVSKFGSGRFTILVNGGGKKGQAQSIQLGISRALLKNEDTLRPLLRSNKLLTRDPRVKERKKPGLKKARRAPQWQKR
ncbi:MAG: 30S ribosomal protein S9 [bacterium]|nr:30S ribosomal protein S9 [bacterium]